MKYEEAYFYLVPIEQLPESSFFMVQHQKGEGSRDMPHRDLVLRA